MIPTLLTALLFVYPIQTNGLVEASARPEIGIVRGFEMNTIRFEGAAGTGYQAIRASIDIPGTKEYGGSHAEVEHRWDRTGERMQWRLDFPLSTKRGLYITIEKEILHVVNWRVSDPDHKDTGRVVESQAFRQRFYLSWYREHLMARFGFTERGEQVGLSLSATW